MNIFKLVLVAVQGTLQDLHIHENTLRDADFTGALMDTIAHMPNLRFLNLARNGQLSQDSSVGILQMMSDIWAASGSEKPLPFEHLIIAGTALLDSGVSQLLPLLATPAFVKFKHLNLTATRLTQEC